jgi:hypothetical protein
MSNTTLADRRRAELLAKLGSVEVEFQHWRDASEPGQPLRKHYRQIRRVTRALGACGARIKEDIEAAAGNDVLARARRLERSILEVHRLWDYFRGKLALRSVSWFQQPLYAVDQLAWACYEPLQMAVTGGQLTDHKEPPLSFFNGAWSPFAVGRGRVYEPERVEGAMLPTTSARDAIRKLPIPVVGVPWYLAAHLPDSPVVCHEVGHLAEQDFGLTGAVEAALEGADIDDDRRPAWRSWRSEVFADVYGCLGAGPAFVSTLMGFLTDDPAAITAQQVAAPGWGKYPTTDLRMAFNFEVLRQMGLHHPADALQQQWLAYYNGDRMSAFRADAGSVAAALLQTPLAPLGNDVPPDEASGVPPRKCKRALADVLAFDQVTQDGVKTEACDLLARKAPDPTDARRLHAAVRLAFDANPVRFHDEDVAARTLDALWDAQDQGVRREAPAPAVEDFERVDEAAGAAIYDAMLESQGTRGGEADDEEQQQ